jgi:drug/metabolite transporter (DMT)-like permease
MPAHLRGAPCDNAAPRQKMKTDALPTGYHLRLDAKAMALMVLLCALWGVQQVAIKVAVTEVPPLLQSGLRSAGAALLVWIWASWRGIPLFARDGSLAPGLLAGLLFAGEFALLYAGLQHTSASRGVLFLYTAPFVVAAGAHLMLPLQAAGLGAAFAGLVLVFLPALGSGRATLLGDALCLAAALLWGATTLVIKGSRLRAIAPSRTLFYQLAVSALSLPLLSLALHEPWPAGVSPLVALSLLYQTAIVAFASYLTWFWLVAHYPAGRLAAFSFLTPIFGLAAGVALLAEPAAPSLLAALALVSTGIYLVNRPVPATGR